MLLTDVLELWAYIVSIATKEFTKEDFNPDYQMIASMFSELKTELSNLRLKGIS